MKISIGVLLLIGSLSFASAQQDSIRKFINFEAVYSALPWANVVGGIDQGFVYMDNLDLTARVNFDRLFNMEDELTVYAYALGNHGGMATDLMGDFQVASNIEAPRTWRLFELWVQQNLFKDRLSMLVGLYDLNSEFDVLTPGTMFINSSFGIGAEYAQSGLNGPSIFPISSFGVRFSSVLSKRIKAKLAILDGVSGRVSDPKSNAIDLSKDDGALVALEFSLFTNTELTVGEETTNRGFTTRRRKVGRTFGEDLVDQINIGGWYYTSPLPIINANDESTGNLGVYLGMQKYFFLSEKKEQYLSLFARYGVANGEFNRLKSALSGGLVLSNFVFRNEGLFGLAFSTGFNSTPYLDLRPNDTESETVVELSYSWPVKNWLMVQPDVQYVINPGTSPVLDNALAIALLVQFSI